MQFETLKGEYVPGVCNIGKEERDMRVRAGFVGLIVTLAIAAVLIFTHVSPLFRLFVFPVALFAALGFIQAAFHFCVRFGAQGVFNFGVKVGDTKNIENQEFHKKDMRKVLLLFVLGVLAAGAFTALVVLIPY